MKNHFLAQVLTMLLILLSATAAMALDPKKPDPIEVFLKQPMTFEIVRNESFECEPSCPQWISAQGMITRNTPAAFKKILKAAGKTHLPIILTSPGGDVEAAISIGKMIRANKLEVAIGRTRYSGCASDDLLCKPAKPKKGVYRGSVEDRFSFCNSACPLLLAAGVRRNAGPPALVGVHQISTTVVEERVYYRETYRMVNGKKVIVNRKIVKRKPGRTYVTTKLNKSVKRNLTSYVSSMGVDLRLLELFEKSPPSSIYWLSTAEMDQTNLTTNHATASSIVGARWCSFDPSLEYCVASSAAKKP